MKRLFTLLFIAVIATGNFEEVIAQADPRAEALRTFSRIRQAYAESVPLGFQVKYTYANESSPLKVLDSTNGYIEVGAKGYYCKLDSTETIQTDSVTVLLFNEDKVMYLSKKSTNSTMLKTNHVALLDSFFLRVPGLQVSVSAERSSRNISLVFPPGLDYKKITFIVDTSNYFITSAVYTVKTDKMMEQPGGGFDKTQYDEFALVKADFFDYTKEPGNTDRLSAGNYFTISKDGVMTTGKYKDYQIFAASPNL